jgi:hypothetical protein
MRTFRVKRVENGKTRYKVYRYFNRKKEGASHILSANSDDFYCDEGDFWKARESVERYCLDVYKHNFVVVAVLNSIGSVDRADVSGAELRGKK